MRNRPATVPPGGARSGLIFIKAQGPGRDTEFTGQISNGITGGTMEGIGHMVILSVASLYN
ncbi:hypothetical protein JCM17843_00280 [Kordiimonadales bacterium JCM 17843]|nr:hypothetical protein JCM17843_00280 [Kordiimonadales bacterium JCM 17843]